MTEWIDLADRRNGRRLSSLDKGEVLLIGALRVWVAAFQKRRCGLPELRWLFNRHDLTGGGMIFHHLLLQTATGAHRTLDIGCPCCPKVQMDEERLLALFAALQHGEAEAAQIYLGSWMPPQSFAPCLRAAETLALMMKQQGYALPQRAGLFQAMDETSRAEVVPIYSGRRTTLSLPRSSA